MVTIVEAKSLELGLIVTAAEAELYGKIGKIKSKHLFECIDDNCNAQVTCANFLKKKRVLEPYFKYVGDHSEKCEELKKIVVNERKEQERKNSRQKKYVSEKHAYIGLSTPSNKKNITTKDHNQSFINNSNDNSSNDNHNINQTIKRPPTKALSTWVKHHIANDDMYLIQDDDDEIHIKDLFIDINTIKNIEDLEDKPRVYFGKFWINIRPLGFSILFHKKVKLSNIENNPSFMIYKNKIRNQPLNGKFSERKLTTLAKNKIPIDFFIFSELPPQLDKTDKYINFYLKDISYLYYKTES